MTHMRLWRFSVKPEKVAAFEAAYGPEGTWARLFRTHPAFIKTELWKASDGTYLTADYWASEADFDRFQLEAGDRYAALDAELEGLCDRETFLAIASSVD